MKNKNELKKIDIKNRVCYYFDDIINGRDINFRNILLDKNLYQNVSVYNISYKTSTRPRPLRIRFDKIDGFVMALDGKIKHLVLFDYGLFDKICNKIKLLIPKESGITNDINHSFEGIRIVSYNSFIFTMTFHIKSIVNKNKNKYCCNIFLEKGLYKDKSNTRYF